MRSFRYKELVKKLEENGLKVLKVYGDTYGTTEFNEEEHRTMLFVCEKL